MKDPFFRQLWTLDAQFSSVVFEIWDFIKRSWSAWASFLHRFRVTGFNWLFVEILDEGLSLLVALCFGLLAYALPPFSGTGDVWNKGREYAVTLTDAKGNVIGKRGIRQYDTVPLQDMPPIMLRAVLATEDTRFFGHFGIDLIGTLRAIVHNSRSDDRAQGGSSITQQVAKNLFLSSERSLQRKIHEAFLALWIEQRLTKEQIIKLYLDRSYLGGGNYGVEAAAQYYFGKSVRNITLPEAAMLAGLFKAPSKYAPNVNPEAAHQRTKIVLGRMAEAGFITQGDVMKALREPAQIIDQTVAENADWFLDWAYKDTIALLEKHKLTQHYVVEVKTSINQVLQRATQAIIDETIDRDGPEYDFTQAAAVIMAPDGAVKAIVGGRAYSDSQFNRATDAKRQTGSSFKPFVFLAALLHGYSPNRTVLDAPVAIGKWAPRNYTGTYAGRITLTSALAHSYNSVPVWILKDIGRDAIMDAVRRVGIRSPIDRWPTFVLGTSVISLMELTAGYATFASGGLLAEPYAVLEIKKSNGEIIYQRTRDAQKAVRAVPEKKIAELNAMLGAVVQAGGTGTRANLGFEPSAGKTGTNQNYRDAWYLGYTAHNVAGVWVGNDDFSPMRRVTGGLIPAPVWKRIIMKAEQGFKPEGLAGLPMNDTYRRYAVANAHELPTSDELPVADETNNALDQPTIATMTDLFDAAETSKQPASAPSEATTPPEQPTPTLFNAASELPTALTSPGDETKELHRTRRSLFDMLFGADKSSSPAKSPKAAHSSGY